MNNLLRFGYFYPSLPREYFCHAASTRSPPISNSIQAEEEVILEEKINSDSDAMEYILEVLVPIEPNQTIIIEHPDKCRKTLRLFKAAGLDSEFRKMIQEDLLDYIDNNWE